MLVIRDEQLRVLARAALPQWVAAHLKKCFPEECRSLGDEGVGQFIRYGLERAAAYGFVSSVHLSQYIDLAITFGARFDEDPELPWARQILTDRAAGTPDARMKRLLAAAQDWLGEGESAAEPDEES